MMGALMDDYSTTSETPGATHPCEPKARSAGQFPLEKGGRCRSHGGRGGAGVVLTSQSLLEDVDGTRLSDSLVLGFPVVPDNPRTAAPSPPLTKGEFAQGSPSQG